jgi:hypothetical protein
MFGKSVSDRPIMFDCAWMDGFHVHACLDAGMQKRQNNRLPTNDDRNPIYMCP